MKEIVVILPEEPSTLLLKMIDNTLLNEKFTVIKSFDNLISLQNKKILFAIELNSIGGSNNLNNIYDV